MDNQSTCDRCSCDLPTEDLIWVSADEFQATAEDYSNGYSDNKLLRMIDKGYSYLCTECYEKEISSK